MESQLSQESDICSEDVFQLLIRDPNVSNILDTDFSSIQVPQQHDYPLAEDATGHTPVTEPWAGPYEFEVDVDTDGNHKKTYFVSAKLNKIFVDMERSVPIKMKWNGTPDLFVRAMMIFTQADNIPNPVKRCITHRDEAYNKQKGYEHCEHVLACVNPAAKYEQDEESHRCSVVVPLGVLPEGSQYVPVSYRFMCKTSCPGGLNRALTDIIFTLEDKDRVVVGRQKLSVKICSCPKRDKDKEEETYGLPPGKKRTKVSKQEKERSCPVPAKRIKTETDDDDEIETFVVSVKGRRNAQELKQMIRTWDFFKACKVMENVPENMSYVSIQENYIRFPPPL